MTAPVEEPDPANASAWATIREALNGSEQDFTTGPVPRAVILLAIPMVLEMVLESVFAVVDVFFVSRLGAAAVAAVGLTESLLVVIYSLAMGLAIAVTAVVARRWGEKDQDGAAHAAAQAVILGVIVAIGLSVIGVIFAEDLLRLMGADDEVVAIGLGYTQVMLGGEVTVILLFLLNAAFRGVGDAAIAMRVLWIANTINIVLDPLLIFGIGPFPELGVTGAAIATTTGRAIGMVIAFRTMVRPGHRLTVRARHFGFDGAVIASMLRLSATATLQFLVGSASWIGLVRLIATFGNAAVAGYTVAIRLVIFGIMPAWGLSNAASTMVGQALGAKLPDRAAEAVRVAGWFNLVFLGVLGVFYLALAPWVVGWFGSDPAVMAVAERALRIVAIGFPLYALGMVLTNAFNGAGDTWTPTWLNFLVFWLWEIPLAWVLAKPLGLGVDGVFWAIVIAFCTLTGASWVIWRRGKWRTTVV
ncbi:MAG: MATE family efflux transporter [Actinomycetota bacterium]|nr:MATE family efflux transporter [Actinomycetota bacterium]